PRDASRPRLPGVRRISFALRSSSCPSGRQLLLYRPFQDPFLVRRKINGLVLVIDCEKPNLRIVTQEVVNHAQTAALSLASLLVLKPELSETASPGHELAFFRLRE